MELIFYAALARRYDHALALEDDPIVHRQLVSE